jgi:hypothetical protein
LIEIDACITAYIELVPIDSRAVAGLIDIQGVAGCTDTCITPDQLRATGQLVGVDCGLCLRLTQAQTRKSKSRCVCVLEVMAYVHV